MRHSVRSLTLAAAALVVTGLAVLLGVLTLGQGTSPAQEREAPAAVPEITLAELDTTALAVRRDAFCDAVPASSVASALDAEPKGARAHSPGDRAQLAEGIRDVAHEHACSWTTPTATARAWVFAPPVSPGQARATGRAAADAEGCSRLPDAPSYGLASVALLCRTDGGQEVSWRGLFGDAWLTCSLRARDVPRAELVDRGGRWCAMVARVTAS
ncbi:hypothetical protein [Nocardioides sp. zg-DK7169]|uniref:hypothetical protein n=1 Tax=Nocardioides sp. zg-DK7169 TaxID=2736600 RepID=UPI00155217DE|nr:hypothetical protein [Nocardioides sp. zg-DK7169]NPC97862.1 hypothetical protein [Nocardioides sp. zg-DK7169]